MRANREARLSVVGGVWARPAGRSMAEWFDCDTGDLFARQNEITSRLAHILSIELARAEAARPTQHPDALEYVLRGRAAALKPNSHDSRAEAMRLFEHALSLDPDSLLRR